MLAARLKSEAGAGEKVGDRARDEHLSRAGLCGDTGSDVYRDAGEVVAAALTFTGMHASAHFYADVVGAVDDCEATTYGPYRAVERGKESVACVLHLGAAVSAEFAADECVVV